MRFLFEKLLPRSGGRITDRWEIRTSERDELIGIVQWRSGWRCYVFEPCFPTVFEQECLRDIATFIEEKTAEHRGAHSGQ